MVVQSIGLVTDLRTQNKNLGVLYIATGQTTQGDENGGTFWWNPSSTAPDDGTDVIQVTGVAVGRWVRLSDYNSYVPTSRTLTINGTTYDLSANRTWNLNLDSVTDQGAVTTNSITVGSVYLTNMTAGSGALYYGVGSNRLTLANYNAGGSVYIEVNGGSYSAVFGSDLSFTSYGTIGGVFNAAATDTDKFIVSDGGVLKYRTGAEVLSDIGAQPAGSYVPTTRTITINGTSYDLSANRTWSVGTVTGTGTANILPKWTGTNVLGNSILDDDGVSASVALAAGGAFNIKYLSAIKLALTGGTTFGSIDVPVGLDFLIRPDSIEKFKLSSTGLLRLAQYGSGTVTGTPTYRLATDASGNIIEVTDGGGTVTSVDMSVPVGLTISGNPITTAGTLALGLAAGYSIPTTANQANWTTAYNDSIVSAAVTGTSTKTLTLNQQDGGMIQASWTDDNTDAVTSVFGRIGNVIAAEGDYSLTQLGDVTITTPLAGQVLKYNGTTWVNNSDGGLTSVGLSMPAAFSVANTPLTSNGTLSVTATGTSAQYIRGDGQLANFPTNGGGGSSVNYYLNGSINQGTFGGATYYEMSKTPIFGAGTDFTRTAAQGNGYIASFITDAGDPALLNIPAGNWNLEFYFSASSGGGAPSFYAELYKVDASNVFTLVASGSVNPEGIDNGTIVDQYFTSISVPQTTLTLTDRLAIRVYVTPDGRNITMHTENSNLCEIITTFSTGLNALNGLTTQVQYFAAGTSGTDFAISSLTDTHTFNLPTASATNRGALSSADWITFNNKQNALTNPVTGTGTAGQVAFFSSTSAITGENNLFWNALYNRLGVNTNNPYLPVDIVADELGYNLSLRGEPSNAVANIRFYSNDGVTPYSHIKSTDTEFLLGSIATNDVIFVSSGVEGIRITNLQEIKFSNIPQAVTDTNRFLVSDVGYIKYRTGAEILSDIGAQGLLTLTTTGSSGSATLIGDTLNIPTYTLSGLGGVPTTRTLTINGTAYDLSADRSWSVGTVTTAAATTGGQVMFANGATVITSVSGLYFDGVDKLGIATTSPAYNLDVTGTARMTGNLTAASIIKSGGTSSQYLMADGSTSTLTNPVTGTGTTNYLPKWTSGSAIGNSIISASATLVTNNFGTSSLFFGQSGSTRFGFATGTATLAFSTGLPLVLGTFDGQPLVFGTNNTENARITDAGNLLVNSTTDNGNRLQVTGNGYFSGNVGIGTSSPVVALEVVGNYRQKALVGNSNGFNLTINSVTDDVSLTNYYNANMIFGTNNTERMRLDSSGNLGLGVTPSAWGSDYKAFQIGSQSAVIGFNGNFTWINTNALFGASSNTYIANGFATTYRQQDGTHAWFTAPSGTAGNAISFTQAMTLDASGRLGIGTTSPQEKFVVSNGGSQNIEINPSFIQSFNRSSPGYAELPFYSSKFSFNVGNVGIGTTSPQGALEVVGLSYFTRSSQSVLLNPNYAGANTHAQLQVVGNMALAFATNGDNERLRITSGGNLGLGTTSPADKFVVSNGGAEGIHFNPSFLSQSYIYTYNRSTNAWVDMILQSLNMIFHTNGGTERMRITSGGDMGLGTSSPAAKLDIIGSLRSEITSDGNFVTLQATGQRVHYIKRSGQILQFTSDGANPYNVQFDSSNKSVYIAAGNLGLGLTSPTQKFSLTGNQVFTNSSADGVANALIAEISSQARGYSNQGANMASIQFRTNPSTWYFGEIAFLTNNSDGTNPSSAATERMRITSGGSLLVGNTTGTELLSVQGNVACITQNNSSNVGFMFQAGSTAKYIWQYQYTDNAVRLYDYASGERMRITSGGNVQIGTTSSSDFRLYSYQNASTGNSTTSALVVRQDGTDPIAIFQGSGGSSKMRISSDGKINFSSLPTSATGLSAGDIWNDGGTLKIV